MDPVTPSILLLDLPPSALAGIDLLSFTTTPQFRGIKSLPAGPHFVFTAPHATLAVRHGAWFYIQQAQPGPVQPVVKKWDAQAETLVPERDEAQLLRIRANLGAVWRGGMAPYRQHAVASGEVVDDSGAAPDGWAALASHVSPGYLSRVFGCGEDGWHASSYSDVAAAGEEVSHFDTDRPLRFIPLDLKRTWRPGAMGRERTEAALDMSWYLDDVAQRCSLLAGTQSDDDQTIDYTVILAEFQFTFLTALTLNNMMALEQWRALVRLVLGCRIATTTRPDFFIAVLDLLRAQLSRLASDGGGGSGDEDTPTTTAPLDERDPTNLEDKTEDELLAYDLPVRSRKSRNSNKPRTTTAPPQQQPSPSITPTGGESELATLFLDPSTDPDGTPTSFLHLPLQRFKRAIRPAATRIASSSSSTTTRNHHQHPVLAALTRLEITLFELFGWALDDNATTDARTTFSPFRGGGGEPSTPIPDNDDDEEEEEDPDFAPAVVQLSQSQLDELGIVGTVPAPPLCTEGLVEGGEDTGTSLPLSSKEEGGGGGGGGAQSDARQRADMRADLAALRGGAMERVVVVAAGEDSSSSGEEDGDDGGGGEGGKEREENDEDWYEDEETLNLEDMDARY